MIIYYWSFSNTSIFIAFYIFPQKNAVLLEIGSYKVIWMIRRDHNWVFSFSFFLFFCCKGQIHLGTLIMNIRWQFFCKFQTLHLFVRIIALLKKIDSDQAFCQSKNLLKRKFQRPYEHAARNCVNAHGCICVAQRIKQNMSVFYFRWSINNNKCSLFFPWAMTQVVRRWVSHVEGQVRLLSLLTGFTNKKKLVADFFY